MFREKKNASISQGASRYQNFIKMNGRRGALFQCTGVVRFWGFLSGLTAGWFGGLRVTGGGTCVLIWAFFSIKILGGNYNGGLTVSTKISAGRIIGRDTLFS